MAKRHSKKYRRKVKTAEIRLKNLARALDECEKMGLKPRLAHGMVFTSVGYVLPPVKKKDRWIVRFALRYDVHLFI